MKDSDCVTFLQKMLPRLGLRWSGFRRVRRQVNKRLQRRLRVLDLPDLDAYCAYLDTHPAEWTVRQFYKGDLRRRGYRLISLSDDIPDNEFSVVVEAFL